MIHVGGTRLFSTVVRSGHFLSCTFLHFFRFTFLQLAHRVHRDGVRWGTLTANAWKLGRGRGATGEQHASLVNFGLLVVQLGIACPPTPYNKMQSWRLGRRWRLVWCVGAWVSMEPWHPFASKKLYISWVIWQVHRCIAVTWLKVMRPFLRHAPCIYIDIRI